MTERAGDADDVAAAVALVDEWAREECGCGGIAACLTCQRADRIVAALAAQGTAAYQRGQADGRAEVRAAVEALLAECRCTLSYPGFDRSPFTSTGHCWAHGSNFWALRKALRAALGTPEAAGS